MTPHSCNPSYSLIKSLNKDLVVISRDGDGTLWVRCTVRKNKRCEISHEDLKGRAAFRPLSGVSYRYERIDATIVDKMLDIIAKAEKSKAFLNRIRTKQ